MAKIVRLREALKNRDTFGFFDDFDHLIEGVSSAGTATDFGYPRWSETGDAGGETTLLDAAGGILQLNTDADDNDEHYLYTTRELFKFANDKPLYWECRLQYTEHNTDDANIIVGVVDAVAADLLVDNGAGPKSSYSGMVLYKVDGATAWVFESSDSTTQVTTTTSTTAGGSSYVTIGAEFHPQTSTTGLCIPYIDTAGGSDLAQMRDTTANAGQLRDIAHQLTFSNATEMAFVIGVKNGGGNAELVKVDYAACYQLR